MKFEALVFCPSNHAVWAVVEGPELGVKGKILQIRRFGQTGFTEYCRQVCPECGKPLEIDPSATMYAVE